MNGWEDEPVNEATGGRESRWPRERGRRMVGCQMPAWGCGGAAGYGWEEWPPSRSQTAPEEHRTRSNPSAAPSRFCRKRGPRSRGWPRGPLGSPAPRAPARLSRPGRRALRPLRPGPSLTVPGRRAPPPPPPAWAPRGPTSCRCPVGPGPGTLGLCPVPRRDPREGPPHDRGGGRSLRRWQRRRLPRFPPGPGVGGR